MNCPQCSWYCPWVASQGATLKPHKFGEIYMKIDEKYFFKHKINYLKLALKISKIRYQGDEPPKKLLQKAHEIGRSAGISEQELENL
jgi:hypothetical protein